MCFGAHFVEVEANVQLGHVRITKYVAVHESGRILNPFPARDQIRGAALQGVGQALHEDLLYDARNGHPLTAGYYRARHLTHLDARKGKLAELRLFSGLELAEIAGILRVSQRTVENDWRLTRAWLMRDMTGSLAT